MKKIILYVILIGFVVAMILPYITGGDEGTKPKVDFNFSENIATNINSVLPIPIKVEDEVKSVNLILSGERLQTWSNPSGVLTFNLDTKKYQVGAYALELQITDKKGVQYTEQRLLRILSDIVPEQWTVEIVNTFPHDETSFTQGLSFHNGKLFEGTGDPNQTGSSIVAEIDLKTGKQLRKIGLDATHFGEGIAVIKDEIFQLTWRNGKCFVYDINNLQLTREMTYTGEGWGLTTDGKELIMSDGTERIFFRNPKTFQVTRTIEAYTNVGAIPRLNELEYHDGLIYANVWMSAAIVVIEASTGKVLASIDGKELEKIGRGNGEVLNGIAYNPETNKWYVTGKNWPKLFEVKFNKPIAM